jgi:hypothetical protein
MASSAAQHPLLLLLLPLYACGPSPRPASRPLLLLLLLLSLYARDHTPRPGPLPGSLGSPVIEGNGICAWPQGEGGGGQGAQTGRFPLPLHLLVPMPLVCLLSRTHWLA